MAFPAARQADEFQFFSFWSAQPIRIRRETISKWIVFYLEGENQGKSLREASVFNVPCRRA